MRETPRVLRVAELRPWELETVDQDLPLNRLDQHAESGSMYLATLLTDAAEQEVRRRGWDRISLSVSAEGNESARRLYEAVGYHAASAPVHVHGTIMLRGESVEVDDILVYLTKAL